MELQDWTEKEIPIYVGKVGDLVGGSANAKIGHNHLPASPSSFRTRALRITCHITAQPK